MTEEYSFEGTRKNINIIKKRMKEMKEADNKPLKKLYAMLIIEDCSIAERCIKDIIFDGCAGNPQFAKIDKEYKKVKKKFADLEDNLINADGLLAAKYLNYYINDLVYAADKEKEINFAEKRLKEIIEERQNSIKENENYKKEDAEHYYMHENRIISQAQEDDQIIQASYYLLDLIENFKKELNI